LTKERIQKIISQAGIMSRRKAELLIKEGRVRVNGLKVDNLGAKADPDCDAIEVDGRLISVMDNRIALVLNKPAGYITTMQDPFNRPTVMDLINDISTRVFPIGRLDIDTEGLLLLTNDGELAYKLTHPRHQIPKTYVVTVHGQVDDDKINALQTGVELSDGSIVKGEVKSVQRGADDTTITMIIYEGKNRQIRRMILTIGHRVKHLKRSQLSFLTLEGIPTGKYRLLNQDEYHRLTELDVNILRKCHLKGTRLF